MNRITGKWKLVSIEGIPRLHPEIDQYMELTDEEISDGVYKAKFTNIQEQFGYVGDTLGEALFSEDGEWHFFSGSFGCNTDEELEENEGLTLNIFSSEQQYVGSKWKILRLTSKELKIYAYGCADSPTSFYLNIRTLTFIKE